MIFNILVSYKASLATPTLSWAAHMTVTIRGDEIPYSKGRIKAPYPVFEAHEVAGRVLVSYDYMAFPRGEPSRNLFAYELDGNQLWRAEGVGFGATDGYTNIISESPLVVGNFACFDCTIDINTGKVIDKTFTKSLPNPLLNTHACKSSTHWLTQRWAK